MASAKKIPAWLEALLKMVTDVRLIIAAFTAAGVTGGGMWAYGDAGTTRAEVRAIADSTAKAEVAPVEKKVDALISILVDAFPQVKKSAEDMARKDSTDRAVKRALMGGN